MKQKVMKAGSVDDLKDVAREFLKSHPKPTVCLLRGDMGVGKTTFVARLCKELGVSEEVSSPTFSLVNEYHIKEREALVYHFDCYRLNKPEEALDFGIEEYFDSGDWCFVEWPEMIEDYLPPGAVEIQVTADQGTRVFIWLDEGDKYFRS